MSRWVNEGEKMGGPVGGESGGGGGRGLGKESGRTSWARSWGVGGPGVGKEKGGERSRFCRLFGQTWERRELEGGWSWKVGELSFGRSGKRGQELEIRRGRSWEGQTWGGSELGGRCRDLVDIVGGLVRMWALRSKGLGVWNLRD
jgi:hypothetical protein